MAVVLASTRTMSRDDWLAMRRRGIGGSDIAAICGLSPWRSPMAVYLDKIGELKEEEESERMYFGKILEDVIAKEFSKRTGLKVRRVNAILQHPKYQWALANIDRKIVGGNIANGPGVLEVKNTSEWNKGEWDRDKLPDYYYLQFQWYLGVTGWTWGYFATLIGGQQLYISPEPIRRDEEVINYLFKIAGEFWRMVINKTPPAIDGTQASTEVLNALYPEGTENEVLILDHDLETPELLKQHDILKANIDQVEAEFEAVKNKLKNKLGEHVLAEFHGRKIRWTNVVSNRLDSKLLRAEQPKIAEQYTKPGCSRRFTVDPVKE